ncbi:inorganic phosphate transporter [Actinomyces sp. MRS3W]|uniref:inorganic phosphate transporter n=1 Tax=Actinomyces sp. MRS3W TaxID=2800796 RepID=UPI0028FD1E10|nr:inorganic phosphate transporter [Actinomyces sp. MRS3W]MDU0349427.1 inorganic phosphate transporter [Actinomyces sp. MRS3W]
MLLTAALAAAFTAVVGRNDGSPLCALITGVTSARPWRPVVFLTAVTALIPLLGVVPVADTYRKLLGDGGTDHLAVVLVATMMTLAAAAVIRAPTSVTLAVVGAATGARLAGGDADWPLVLRVLALAALGPMLAGACARVARVVLGGLHPRHAGRWIEAARRSGFVSAGLAYALNDGQKLFAVWAVTLAGISDGDTCGRAVPYLVGAGAAAAFALGTWAGLRPSGRALRGGVVPPKPYQVVNVLWATALAVAAGSLAGAPVSMTQATVGAQVGSVPGAEWRRVRWNAVGRIAAAWAWTLPVSLLCGLGGALLIGN